MIFLELLNCMLSFFYCPIPFDHYLLITPLILPLFQILNFSSQIFHNFLFSPEFSFKLFLFLFFSQVFCFCTLKWLCYFFREATRNRESHRVPKFGIGETVRAEISCANTKARLLTLFSLCIKKGKTLGVVTRRTGRKETFLPRLNFDKRASRIWFKS